jgi:hypothetical protein
MAVVLALPTAEAANTSRPTGRGAVHDNSVYCQNWPGQPSRGPYRGTGPQNPFGDDCRPGPRPEPRREPPPDAFPVRRAAAPAGGILPAAHVTEIAHGLWVASRQIGSAREVGLEHLTQRRAEVFSAMRCSENRKFTFANSERLAQTIELRTKIIERMEGRLRAPPTSVFSCSLSPPSGWEHYPEPRATMMAGGQGVAARSKPGLSAHAAVEQFRSQPSSLDCHAGVQVTVLDAAAAVLGPARFDRLHPLREWPHFSPVRPDGQQPRHALVGVGVGVGVALLQDVDRHQLVLPGLGTIAGWGTRILHNDRYTSMADHLKLVRYSLPRGSRNERAEPPPDDDQFYGRIDIADMVPGDWAFLKNIPDYQTHVPYGSLAGENVFYIRERTPGDPTSRVFFGFVLEGAGRFLTAAELATAMANDFNQQATHRPQIQPGAKAWTRLGAPTLDSTHPHEAGPFIR